MSEGQELLEQAQTFWVYKRGQLILVFRAAAGPFVMGALRDLSGGWTVPLLLLLRPLADTDGSGYVDGMEMPADTNFFKIK